MDITNRYLDLARRGRRAFLASAAPAALLRRRGTARPAPVEARAGAPFADFLNLDPDGDTTTVGVHDFEAASPHVGDLEVYPLIKKPGAAFADMITVGRTGNNDVVLADVTVSRFHAFFRQRGEHWIVCDAGSKNGTQLAGERLSKRVETPIRTGLSLRVGDVEAVFYDAAALFDVLDARD
jgi:hypothetical protein